MGDFRPSPRFSNLLQKNPSTEKSPISFDFDFYSINLKRNF